MGLRCGPSLPAPLVIEVSPDALTHHAVTWEDLLDSNLTMWSCTATIKASQLIKAVSSSLQLSMEQLKDQVLTQLFAGGPSHLILCLMSGLAATLQCAVNFAHTAKAICS